MFDEMLDRNVVACYRKTESMWKLNNQQSHMFQLEIIFFKGENVKVVECGFMHKPCSTKCPTEMPVLAIQKHIIRFFSVSMDAVYLSLEGPHCLVYNVNALYSLPSCVSKILLFFVGTVIL
ncbi:uncharacterized protein LOC121770814 isoform X2 [Salvia splendens]|uniref:uncharacterized protein LOC121770814 isoform X2 n=1 Tax=Salvia splendens TaxID=180675 RepID=UPI001C25C0C3|nr:uncharacterized protein LOC121770814 isoform X2 [Salvia splendens]